MRARSGRHSQSPQIGVLFTAEVCFADGFRLQATFHTIDHMGVHVDRYSERECRCHDRNLPPPRGSIRYLRAEDDRPTYTDEQLA